MTALRSQSALFSHTSTFVIISSKVCHIRRSDVRVRSQRDDTSATGIDNKGVVLIRRQHHVLEVTVVQSRRPSVDDVQLPSWWMSLSLQSQALTVTCVCYSFLRSWTKKSQMLGQRCWKSFRLTSVRLTSWLRPPTRTTGANILQSFEISASFSDYLSHARLLKERSRSTRAAENFLYHTR